MHGIHVMAYDVPGRRSYDQGEAAYFLSVRATDGDELTRYWNALAEGAEIIDPFGPAPWGSPLYGQLRDRFGVIWVMDLEVAW